MQQRRFTKEFAEEALRDHILGEAMFD